MPTASSTKLKERASRKGWSELGATLIFAASIFAVTCHSPNPARGDSTSARTQSLPAEPPVTATRPRTPRRATTWGAYRLIRRARNTAGRNIFHQSSRALIFVYAMPSVGGGYSIVTGASTTL